MKYAKFVNTKSVDYNVITGMINMGDNIQSFAIDNLFKYAGIESSSIVGVPFYGKPVTSEPCYLIVNGHFGRQYDMDFMENSDIYPIFIGFAIKDSFLLQEEVEYFKKYEPVLCRDEFTKNVLRKYNIDAYMSGCLTETFPQREKEGKSVRDKYYFVDVKEEFQRLIPKEIRQNAVFVSQNIPVDIISDSIMEYGQQSTLERMEEYKANAKMIITSKLHCMIPCTAMGIPTIAVGDNFSYRYSFADTFIDAYDKEQFEKYDWSIPQEKVDMEMVKQLLLDVGKSMIERQPDMDKIRQLDDIYCKRDKWEYFHGIKRQLKEIFRDTNDPKYILWGASSGGYAIHECIMELWPDSELEEIVDSFAEGIFAGKEIKKPKKTIDEHTENIVIVSTLSGQTDAEAYFKEIGKKKNKDYFIIHESI